MGDSTTALATRRPRLWPGILIVLLYWAALKVPGWLIPGTMEQFFITGLGTMGLALLFFVWWVFFSRVRWSERFFGLLACAVVGAGAWYFYHPTIQGADPFQTFISLTFNILPVVFAGWVLWYLVTRFANPSMRCTGLVLVFALTFGVFTALRFDGVTGAFSPEFSLRTRPTTEERYAASRAQEKNSVSFTADAANATKLALDAGDWPGFRGAARDGRRTGVRIATDWKQNPPKELWRRQIGPGWGSFAVVGNRLFTQEQLKEFERVVCYDAATGKEVWAHADTTRHSDSESGAGPRATPTFSDGRIYSLGATGRLNCLDAATGKLIWTHDIVEDSKATRPIWGFSSSPLVSKGIVTVFAGGPDGKSALGYKADSGELAWSAGKGTNSYCSMHPATIAGVEQLILVSGEGMTSFDPASGKVLWDYDWNIGEGMNRCTQPTVVDDHDVLIGTGFGNGTRRLHLTKEGDNWKLDQVWESTAISPYFNDSVIYQGHIYGFHNNFLTCVDLASGKAKWKERGYANGQAVLLADQGLLVVITEEGKVALVEASPDRLKNLGRFQAFEGKTWNHPVVANGRLYVRNGSEAACYELKPESKSVAGK